MKLNNFLFFSLTIMALVTNVPTVNGQDILIGKWKEIEWLSDGVKIKNNHPDLLTLDKNGKYLMVLYAFDYEDSLGINPKKIEIKGKYKVNSQNDTITLIHKDKTRYDLLFKLSNGILEITEDRGDRGEGLRGARIIIKKYIRVN